MAGPPSSEGDRMAELRAILPESSDQSLRQLLRDNDQASENARVSAGDSVIAAAAAQVNADAAGEAPPPRPITEPARRGGKPRRSWVPVMAPPSRPGPFGAGGPAVEAGGDYNIGVTDPIELEVKRIEAMSQVQEMLNKKLGYNLRESNKYQEMEREYREGERLLALTASGRGERVLSEEMMWDLPPLSRFGGQEKEPQDGGNGRVCVGKFVDPGPGDDEGNRTREKTTLDGEPWADIPIDHSPIGPYDHVVRCWKCLAGLRVHVEAILIACPRCRTLGPATFIGKIG